MRLRRVRAHRRYTHLAKHKVDREFRFSVRATSLALVGVLFYLAGLNHFRVPEFYRPLVPGWIDADLAVRLSGWAEIILGVLVFPHATRKWAGWGLALLLVAFIPAHIHFITLGNCINDTCFPVWQGWVRLLVVQPLLIGWVVWSSKRI